MLALVHPSDDDSLDPLSLESESAADPVLASAVRVILERLGEDPNRDGLKRTPDRVARALAFLTRGLRQDVKDVVGQAIFEVDFDELVLVKDIEFHSLCEHHMLPFEGRAHIAYLPRGKVIGLSKLPRLVDMFARRLQVQERLTRQLAETVQSLLDPQGTAVILEATHLCMKMRGVAKQQSTTTTSSMLGAFRDNPTLRAELLACLTGRTSR